MTYTAEEYEVIGLCVGLEAVADIVNHALLTFLPVTGRDGEGEIRFPTRTHQQLFLARLLDFAKEGGDSALTGIKGSCLDVLSHATSTRSFDHHDSVLPLASAVGEFRSWLAHATPLQLWLPTLDINATLEVPRLEYLYISGNYVKHNLSRLTAVSKRIKRMLDDHGYNVPLELVPLALDDFREHLQEDYFAYYGTWLAELINNIRWGLHDYLQPVFARCYVLTLEKPAYTYEYPSAISNRIPRAWFWRLMNHTRSGPYLRRFRAPAYSKLETLRGGE